jgi:hypothetical protein
MCSSAEAGSYLRLIDVAYHSTLGLRVIKKKKMTFTSNEFGSVNGIPALTSNSITSTRALINLESVHQKSTCLTQLA